MILVFIAGYWKQLMRIPSHVFTAMSASLIDEDKNNEWNSQ